MLLGWREGVLAGLLLLLLLIGSEMFLRAYGIWPSVADSRLLWSMQRAQARGDRVIVILGSSRSLLGIVPEVLEEEFPGWRVVHLGVDGTAPYAVLRDLVADPAFRGLILCEMIDGSLLPQARGSAQPWVNHYRREYPRLSSIEKRFNEWARVQMQSRFALVSPAMGLGSMVLIGPYKSYERMQANRYRPAYYRARMLPEKLAEHRARQSDRARMLVWRALGADEDAELLRVSREELRPLYAELKSRGGELVLVRMPTSGEQWEQDQILFPKKKYWDVIGPETGVPVVYFSDFPNLNRFDCPDTSHLDAEDAPEFTRALARIVRTTMGPNAGDRP